MEELALCAKKGYKRLDKFLAEQAAGHSRSFYQGLIAKGEVLINGRPGLSLIHIYPQRPRPL